MLFTAASLNLWVIAIIPLASFIGALAFINKNENEPEVKQKGKGFLWGTLSACALVGIYIAVMMGSGIHC